MRIAPIVLALAALVVPLSGCIGGDEAATPDQEPEVPREADEVKVTDTTGSIKGTVASDLFEPLAGADVTLIETGQATKVSRSGAFTINNVEPGTYTLFIVAVGYESLTRNVPVHAGEVTELQVHLRPLPSDEPWVDFREWVGQISWAVAWQVEPPVLGCQVIELNVWTVKNCGGLRGGGSANGEVDLNVTDDVKTVMAELVWNPVGPLGEFLHLDLLCPDVPRDGERGAVLDINHPCFFDPKDSESPIQIRVDEPHWQEHGYNITGDWHARVFSTYGMLGTYDVAQIDAGVAYQQPFVIYTSVFHKAGAAEGYSGIPDA